MIFVPGCVLFIAAKNLPTDILFVVELVPKDLLSNRNHLTCFDTQVVFAILWTEIIYLTILYESWKYVTEVYFLCFWIKIPFLLNDYVRLSMDRNIFFQKELWKIGLSRTKQNSSTETYHYCNQTNIAVANSWKSFSTWHIWTKMFCFKRNYERSVCTNRK